MLDSALKVNLSDLTNYNQFVLYKILPSKSRPGKFDKITCDVSFNNVDAHNPSNWMDAETALLCSASMSSEHGHGVGFSFTANDPFFFVDIDGAYDGANWSPVATDLCTRLGGCFVEISQSGTGLHIIGKYSGPEPAHGCTNKHLGLECYTSGRFVALTGNAATGDVAMIADGPFLGVIQSYFTKTAGAPLLEEVTTTAEAEHTPIEDDDELIKKALNSVTAKQAFGNDASFADLWNRNVTALAQHYPDDTREFDNSGAEMGLANRLIWWASGNAERAIRLLKSSPLCAGREAKFTRGDDYLGRTMCDAYSFIKAKGEGFYSCKKVVEPVQHIQQTSTLDFEQLPADWVLTEVSSETGRNAQLMLDAYYNDRLFARGKESYWWNGAKYQEVTEKQLKKSVSNSLVGTGQHKENIVNGTANMLQVRADEIEALNPANARVYFTNGVIDFESPSRTLEPHTPANFNNYTLPFDYNPSAPEPIEMLTFLNSAFEGDEDIELKIIAVQEVLGWALIGSTLGIQKGVVLRGSTRAGKGTVLHVLLQLLGRGNYTSVGELSALTEDKVKSTMRDSNIVIDFDAKSVPLRHIDGTVSMINKLTANEPTDIKLLYTPKAWNGPMDCKLYMACNALPTMIDDTGAIIGRLHQIMFNNSFLNREDTYLSQRLDAELSSIGNWAIKGLERLVTNRRFTVPSSSFDAQQEASETSQPLTMFIEECLVVGSHDKYRCHTDFLYARWCRWCEENGTKPGSSPNFSKRLNDTLRSEKVIKVKQLRIGTANKSGFKGVDLCRVTNAPSVASVPPLPTK